MSRRIVFLAVLTAAFTLALGTADAQARHCRSYYRYDGCGQHSNCGYRNCRYQHDGYGNCGYQRIVHYRCQPTRSSTTTRCCDPQPTCIAVQPACATSVLPGNDSALQPSVQQAAPAPAPAPEN